MSSCWYLTADLLGMALVELVWRMASVSRMLILHRYSLCPESLVRGAGGGLPTPYLAAGGAAVVIISALALRGAAPDNAAPASPPTSASSGGSSAKGGSSSTKSGVLPDAYALCPCPGSLHARRNLPAVASAHLCCSGPWTTSLPVRLLEAVAGQALNHVLFHAFCSMMHHVVYFDYMWCVSITAVAWDCRFKLLQGRLARGQRP